jgi:hypothetical protein
VIALMRAEGPDEADDLGLVVRTAEASRDSAPGSPGGRLAMRSRPIGPKMGAVSEAFTETVPLTGEHMPYSEVIQNLVAHWVWEARGKLKRPPQLKYGGPVLD